MPLEDQPSQIGEQLPESGDEARRVGAVDDPVIVGEGEGQHEAWHEGAVLVRMLAELLGPELFRAGTDLYFKRHDGEAATCDDFVAAMEEASGFDLAQFKLWYSQAGTPVVKVSGDDATLTRRPGRVSRRHRRGASFGIPGN